MVREHKRVWRRLLAAWLIVVCLQMWAAAIAQTAEDPLEKQRLLEVSLTVKPGEMVASGDATMTFVIVNPTEFDVQNVYLASSDGALSEPIGQIDAGETQTLVRTHNVTEEELSAGEVSYVISHDPLIDGTEKINYIFSAPVVRVDARPSVDFTRQISSDYVARGGVAVITYKVRNTGNVALSGLRVRDSLGDFTGRSELLDIGETRTFISRVTINDAAVSQPSLEYTVPGGDAVDMSLDAHDILLAEGDLEAHFSVGESAFSESTADAILTLNNIGNTDYTDITVLDDIYGGVIADSIDLPCGGDPVEIAYTYPIRGDANYRWRITGVDQAGEKVDFLTKTYTLSGDSEVEDISVSITATPSMTSINRPGYVTFAFEISNTGTDMAQDALLYEVNQGQIIPDEFYSRETRSYLPRMNAFGLPLDSRADYTKSDWIAWCAAMARDEDTRKALLSPVAHYLRSTKTRVPFSDWYDTVSGDFVEFIARSVQGGLFMPLLTAE